MADFGPGVCTICTGTRSFMGLREVMPYLVPNAISNLNAYLLAINVEKNDGRREKSSGRMIGTETEVSHSKMRVVIPAKSNCQSFLCEVIVARNLHAISRPLVHPVRFTCLFSVLNVVLFKTVNGDSSASTIDITDSCSCAKKYVTASRVIMTSQSVS